MTEQRTDKIKIYREYGPRMIRIDALPITPDGAWRLVVVGDHIPSEDHVVSGLWCAVDQILGDWLKIAKQKLDR